MQIIYFSRKNVKKKKNIGILDIKGENLHLSTFANHRLKQKKFMKMLTKYTAVKNSVINARTISTKNILRSAKVLTVAK